ncbi:MAG: EamA family transporter, partial [Carboxydocellales bacterium]
MRQNSLVALSLALTFGTYGLVKKLVHLSSLAGLALETAFIAPVALIYLILLQVKGTGSMGTVSIQTTLLLICSGIVTAVPLLWFASGAKRVSLSTVGFVQYLSPTITLFLGPSFRKLRTAICKYLTQMLNTTLKDFPCRCRILFL